jgi:hypothetical protein
MHPASRPRASPSTNSGVRVRDLTRRSYHGKYLSFSPTFSIDTVRPSAKTFGFRKPMEPAVAMPTSATWVTELAQAITRPSWQMGMHMSKSGVWMPP